MTELRQTNSMFKALFLTVILCFLPACTGLYRQAETPFDISQIENIRFNFDHPASFGTNLPEQAIATKVAANLAEWGYPISADPDTQASHKLTVDIGTVSHQATPVGFSFSAGSSDPRALDFQKSDVLPITCVLSPMTKPQHRAELSMSFAAGLYLQKSIPQADQAKLIALLENDISTVCFNLLSELDVPTRQKDSGGKSTSKPSWIPEIRLEVENDADTTDEIAQPQTPSENPKPTKQHPPRKRIIIHNQGSPVIFKFGHERK